MENLEDDEQALKCVQCGFVRSSLESRCPQCGGLNSKIDDILAREEEQIKRNTFVGRCEIIWQADDRKAELLKQISLYKQTLPKNAGLVFYVVIAFIFFMVFSVM